MTAPGVTNGMLDDWDELHEQQVQDDMERDPRLQQATAAGAQIRSNVQKRPVTSGNGK